MDRPAVRRGRPEQFQHRFGRVVVENKLMERVGIERPSARPPGERAFEDGAEVVMHPTGAIDVRVSREDEVDASVLMGLEQSPFNGQPNPSFHRVRFLRMVFRDEPRSRAAVDVHVAGKDQGRACGFRGRERVLRENRDHPRPLGIRDRRRMDDDLYAVDRIDNGFPRAKVDRDHLRPYRESGRPSAGANDGADLVAREARSADDGPSDQSPRTEDRNPHAPRTIAATEKDDAFEGGDPPTCTMHARARLMPPLRPSPEGPLR